MHTHGTNEVTTIDSRPMPSIDVETVSAGRARGMDGSLLNVSKEDFAELFAMNGSNLFCQPQNEAAI
ncbi:hypothetical protein DY000_02014646 [Brassica cretica]|uniref:Ataxin-2 C-terminal domain-containing protein n=1 Tax=Brassica cretica TaxID=69181 RepID=A0ABQ7D9J2_BRACR|nr:hypothetical protein DY000_02014646 [Brassica cretica]